MIDFHSHVLPGIDDGAKDINTSLDMLANSYEQGVKTVVATPHCYLTNEKSIPIFIKKREQGYKLLKEAIKNDERKFPNIVLGCELRVSNEAPKPEELRKLCIENTDYIMVEMPYDEWNANYYDFIYTLILGGMKPIMAHIERFLDHYSDFHNLYSFDLIYQVNADSFIHPAMKRKLPKLFEDGAIHLIGSDMHDMNKRPPSIKKAANRIIKGYGKYRLNYLMDNAYAVLENKRIDTLCFGKLGFMDMLKL